MQWQVLQTHLPFTAPFVFTRLINSVTTLLGPILPSSKVEAPEFQYTLPCVQRSVYIARWLQVFLNATWDTANLHPLTHPTFVSTSFSIGHEFSWNILGSNRKKEADLPLGNVKGWLGTNRCRWQFAHGSRTDIKIFITLRDCNSVIGHGIGGKDIPIMARLAKARRWSKRWQTCLSSPNLTANHNKWWLEDPSTLHHVLRKDPTISYVEYLMNPSNEYLGRARVAGTLKRISYKIHVSYVCK